MAPIRISRAGLVECPACRTHIYVADTVDDTVCPFCKVGLRVAASDDSLFAVLRNHAGVAGGILASALASLPGCSDNEGPPVVPVYGVPVDVVSDANGDANGGQDTSGAVDAGSTQDVSTGADTGPVDAGPTDTGPKQEDAPVVALYGGPPIEDTSHDTGSVEDAGSSAPDGDSAKDAADAKKKDIAVAPLYGMPIDIKQSKDDAGSESDADDPPPAPEYGIPPNP